jgi:hypothetical protein
MGGAAPGTAVASARPVALRADPPRRVDAGFSVIELCGVLAVTVSLLGIGLGGLSVALDTVHGDAGMNAVLWQLKVAREAAISQHRPVEIRFRMPDSVSVVRHNLPTGETLISTATLEHRTEFYAFAGMPDTPDGFGKTGPVSFGPATAVMFNAEGELVDQAGRVIRGSVFIGNPDTPVTARAVTVGGPASTIRTYRWDRSAWRR